MALILLVSMPDERLSISIPVWNVPFSVLERFSR